MIWAGLLALAFGCDDQPSCASEVGRAAHLAAAGYLDDRQLSYLGVLRQAYVRYLQVTTPASERPGRFDAVCRELSLPGCVTSAAAGQTVTVRGGRRGLGGLRVEYRDPSTERTGFVFTDPDGVARIPVEGEPEVRLEGGATFQATRSLRLDLPRPKPPTGGTDWRSDSWWLLDGSRPKAQDTFVELAEGVWIGRDERYIRFIVLDGDHAVEMSISAKGLVVVGSPRVHRRAPVLDPGGPVPPPEVPSIPLLRARQAVALDRNRFLRRDRAHCYPSWSVLTLTPTGRFLPLSSSILRQTPIQGEVDRDLYNELLEASVRARRNAEEPACEEGSTEPVRLEILLRIHPDTPIQAVRSALHTAGLAQYDRFWVQVRARKGVDAPQDLGEPVPLPNEGTAGDWLEQRVRTSTWNPVTLGGPGDVPDVQEPASKTEPLGATVYAVPLRVHYELKR